MGTVRELRKVCDYCGEQRAVLKYRLGDESVIYRVELCRDCRSSVPFETLLKAAAVLRAKSGRAVMKVTPMTEVRRQARDKK